MERANGSLCRQRVRGAVEGSSVPLVFEGLGVGPELAHENGEAGMTEVMQEGVRGRGKVASA